MLTRRHIIFAAAAAPLASVAIAQSSKPSVYSDRGLAIRGTDPVAYFTEGRAVAGSADHEVIWNGTVWRFASAANREAFEGDPEAYAPQYGGYCAWAVAEGYTASIDPDAWHIEGGKLYLNFSRRVQRRWLRDVPGNITRGDANWPSVLQG